MVKRAPRLARPGQGDSAARLLRPPPRESARKRGYNTAWDRARGHYLAKYPFCAVAALSGRVRVAEVVDHLYPHCGNKDLFWLSYYWVPMSAHNHNKFKQRIERKGIASIDRLALELGRVTLSEREPALYSQWFQAYARRGVESSRTFVAGPAR